MFIENDWPLFGRRKANLLRMQVANLTIKEKERFCVGIFITRSTYLLTTKKREAGNGIEYKLQRAALEENKCLIGLTMNHCLVFLRNFLLFSFLSFGEKKRWPQFQVKKVQ